MIRTYSSSCASSLPENGKTWLFFEQKTYLLLILCLMIGALLGIMKHWVTKTNQLFLFVDLVLFQNSDLLFSYCSTPGWPRAANRSRWCLSLRWQHSTLTRSWNRAKVPPWCFSWERLCLVEWSGQPVHYSTREQRYC